ncbi:MAG: hypothetical protein ABSH48_02475 [Verrucomicrobiota bacterium]
MHPFAIEPLAADFLFARTLIVRRSQRTVQNTGVSTTESRYYLSSSLPQQSLPEQWLGWIAGPWGGVEIRNHWRRHVLMGEDRSRSRQPNLLANLALIRSVLLPIFSPHLQAQPFPAFRENLASRPGRCWNLLTHL